MKFVGRGIPLRTAFSFLIMGNVLSFQLWKKIEKYKKNINTVDKRKCRCYFIIRKVLALKTTEC